MNRATIPFLSAILIGLPLLALAQAPNEEVRWHNDYDLAWRLAAAENKPLLVCFRCVP